MKRYNFNSYFLSDKFKIISIAFVILLTIVFLIQMYSKAYREDGIDFTSYLLSSRAFLFGNNPYHTNSPFIYIYPLFFTVILIPFTFLPYWVSLLLWFLLGIFSFYFSIVIILNLIKEKSNFNQFRFWGLPLFLLIVFLSNILQNNLLNGQVNLFVMSLSILFFYYFIKNKLVAAAIFLAIAISIKIVPIIFLVVGFRKRTLSLLPLTLLFVLIFCLLFPYLIQAGKIFGYYHEYLNEFIFSKAGNAPIITAHSLFFTLYGFIIFLFPSLTEIKLLQIICSLIVLIILMTIYYKTPLQNLEENGSNILSLIFISILLISPISETHHLIFILPAVVVILRQYLFIKKNIEIRNIILLSLFISTFWLGNFLKVGIYYFISLIILYLIMIKNIIWKIKIEKV